jgi:GT2 family glycosyltransferase
MQLQIAILTHNALEYTERCLSSLARETIPAHQIYILDNASTDRTPAWLSEHAAPHWKVTLSPTNLGVPGGRNQLFRELLPRLLDDDLVVFLDNDVEVNARWYEPYLELLAANPRAGIVGAIGHPIIVHSDWRELLPSPVEEAAPVDVVSGFCFWVRAETARAVGFFDEQLGLFWHEDDDYCVRAIHLGYKVFAIPGPAIVHHGHKSGAAEAGIERGGSPENQRYLASKWRQLGCVDEAGRVIHRKIDSDEP